MKNNLLQEELVNIDGGAKLINPFKVIYEIYRTIRIKLFIKKLWID